jgi:deazaflavin-dependent oxidoreductase (nitroreductase family)
MRRHIDEALEHSPTVDITTWGRRSGLPRRVEIWMYRVSERYFITGTPGPRDWYANLLSDPRFTVHIDNGKETLDLPALAVPVRDPLVREMVFTAPHIPWYRSQAPLDELVTASPMIEVEFP